MVLGHNERAFFLGNLFIVPLIRFAYPKTFTLRNQTIHHEAHGTIELLYALLKPQNQIIISFIKQPIHPRLKYHLINSKQKMREL